MTPNVSRPAGAPLSRALARPRDARRGRGDRPRSRPRRGARAARATPATRAVRRRARRDLRSCGHRRGCRSTRRGAIRADVVASESKHGKARPSVIRPDARVGYSSFPTLREPASARGRRPQLVEKQPSAPALPLLVRSDRPRPELGDVRLQRRKGECAAGARARPAQCPDAWKHRGVRCPFHKMQARSGSRSFASGRLPLVPSGRVRRPRARSKPGASGGPLR
jgi:hypothetical protein